MKCLHARLVAAVLTGGVLAPLLAMAGDILSADEVRRFIVGNTAHGKTPAGKGMKNYFDPSGNPCPVDGWQGY